MKDKDSIEYFKSHTQYRFHQFRNFQISLWLKTLRISTLWLASLSRTRSQLTMHSGRLALPIKPELKINSTKWSHIVKISSLLKKLLEKMD